MGTKKSLSWHLPPKDSEQQQEGNAGHSPAKALSQHSQAAQQSADTSTGQPWPGCWWQLRPSRDEHPETGTALLLPGLGWAASGHTKQISPSSREPTTSWAEYPGDFVLFQMFFVLPLPFPLRHLLTVRHRRAGQAQPVCAAGTQPAGSPAASRAPHHLQQGLQSNQRPWIPL